MEHSILLNSAKELAAKVKKDRPYCSDLDMAVIISEKGTFLGVTGIDITDGKIVDVPADVEAFLHFHRSGARKAVGMAVIKLEDLSLIPPSEDVMELMFRASTENDGCTVCLGEKESKPLSVIRIGSDSRSMMDGFESDEPADKPVKGVSSADTTVNVISGVAVDESNPFYETAKEVAPPEETLSVMTDEQKKDTLKNTNADPALTPEELLKQAKKRKNVAKSNFLFRKKHK